MKVVIRRVTSARSMPERRSAHAVSTMPPAPALANTRVAAWPASVISVLARSPMRPPPLPATARSRIAWPTKERTSKPSARASHAGSPPVSFFQASGSSATAGASRIADTTSSAAGGRPPYFGCG
jgi:hypothetical protein